jgi:hypothetical protein
VFNVNTKELTSGEENDRKDQKANDGFDESKAGLPCSIGKVHLAGARLCSHLLAILSYKN